MHYELKFYRSRLEINRVQSIHSQKREMKPIEEERLTLQVTIINLHQSWDWALPSLTRKPELFHFLQSWLQGSLHMGDAKSTHPLYCSRGKQFKVVPGAICCPLQVSPGAPYLSSSLPHSGTNTNSMSLKWKQTPRTEQVPNNC